MVNNIHKYKAYDKAGIYNIVGVADIFFNFETGEIDSIGCYVQCSDDPEDPDIRWKLLTPSTVDLVISTLMHDKKGQEIFCKDLLQLEGNFFVGQVAYDEGRGMWCFDNLGGTSSLKTYLDRGYVKIGNAVENPELLKMNEVS